MNILQINNILKQKLGRVFKGVHALDQLACLNPHAPAAFVFNTKPITAPGEHWIGVYVLKNIKVLYFDSFGFPPQHTEIIRFLKKHATKWTF